MSQSRLELPVTNVTPQPRSPTAQADNGVLSVLSEGASCHTLSPHKPIKETRSVIGHRKGTHAARISTHSLNSQDLRNLESHVTSINQQLRESIYKIANLERILQNNQCAVVVTLMLKAKP